MAVEQVTETIYKCTCNWKNCLHKWESDHIPERCAKCKRYTWNRAAIRHGRGGKQVEAFGRSQTIAEWGKEYNLSRAAIHARIKIGWTVEDAISKPIQNKAEEVTEAIT